MQRDPLALELIGSTIKFVAQAYHSGFTLPPASRVTGTMPPLPIGKYRVELYTRMQPDGKPGGNPANLGPEQFLEAKSFEVYQNPPTCAATTVEVVGNSFAVAAINAPYSNMLSAKVTDAHGNPVPNYKLWLSRLRPPDEPSTNDPQPDVSHPPGFLTTGADGIARFSGSANNTPGVFQYRTFLRGSSTFIFYNVPANSSFPNYPVVEFARSTPLSALRHFFMTGNEDEMAKLDLSSDWERTGAVFMTFSPGSNRPGTTPVCRFYGLPAAGLDSHFFSASPVECDQVRQRFANAWTLETADAFEVFPPNTNTGACPIGTRSLYRAFNNLPDANHRYALTHDVGLLNARPEGGPRWSLEGYGVDSVVMCLPQ